MAAPARPSDLPDLDGLVLNTTQFAIGKLFGGPVPPPGVHGVMMNLVRLVDFSVMSYKNARAGLDAYHQPTGGPNIDSMMWAVGHFENCIWSLERSLKLIALVRGLKDAPAPLKDAIIDNSNPRTPLKILQGDVVKILTRLRHVVAHIDEQMADGRIPAGALALWPQPSGLEFGTHRIPYSDLAAWITEAHGCATRVTAFVNSVPGTSPAAAG